MNALRPRREKLTQKERLSLKPNHGEALLGYKWVVPFDDGLDKEGMTKEEAGPLIINNLDSRGKNEYLRRIVEKGNKPDQPAMLVPVFLSTSNISGNFDFNGWTIRSFRVEFTELYEKKHWWSAPRLVLKDYLTIIPDISCYILPDADPQVEPVIKYWESLDQKAVTLEQLRELLGLPNETKTA